MEEEWRATELPANKKFNITLQIDGSVATIRLIDVENGATWVSMTTASIADFSKAFSMLTFKTSEGNILPPKFSEENFLSRRFEEQVAAYLVRRFNYDAAVGIKPAYLDGKEIDVLAEKGVMPKTITVCECKLRLNESPITIQELNDFAEKIVKIKQNETKRGEVKFFFWFVSNTDRTEDGVKESAKKERIELMKAELSKNWKGRSDWSVVEINTFGD